MGASRWWHDAACHGLAVDLFFVRPIAREAIEACARCPVRLPCLRDALDWEATQSPYQPKGHVGGLSVQARNTARQALAEGARLEDLPLTKWRERPSSQRQHAPDG